MDSRICQTSTASPAEPGELPIGLDKCEKSCQCCLLFRASLSAKFVREAIMKSKQIIRMVEQDGWYLKRTSGSHRIYKHPTKPGTVVIAYHGAKDIPEGTIRSILKDAGLE